MGKMRSCVLLFLFAVLCSCSAVPEKHYFTMSYVLLPNKSRLESTFPYTLRVRQLDIGAAYDTERIVYRYSPYEFQYYNFMIWAAKPQRMLTDLIVRHLQHAKLFGDVAFDYHERVPDYELSGTVFAIEELDSGDQWYAHLSISLRMTRYRGEKVVWSHDINVKKQVYNKAPVYVVKALSELTEVEMTKIVDRLEKFLRSEAVRERTGS
jgi:ABC-type uncharacterized transport system auxiliary subunit